MLLSLLAPVLTFILPILSIFLILLVLVQRGRGGGLVGAFGGMGGQSAFGAKAGDVFTRITVITVCIWIAICVVILLAMKQGDTAGSGGFGGGRTSEPAATAPVDSNVTIPISAESP